MFKQRAPKGAFGSSSFSASLLPHPVAPPRRGSPPHLRPRPAPPLRRRWRPCRARPPEPSLRRQSSGRNSSVARAELDCGRPPEIPLLPPICWRSHLSHLGFSHLAAVTVDPPYDDLVLREKEKKRWRKDDSPTHGRGGGGSDGDGQDSDEDAGAPEMAAARDLAAGVLGKEKEKKRRREDDGKASGGGVGHHDHGEREIQLSDTIPRGEEVLCSLPMSPARPLRFIYFDTNEKLVMDPEAMAALQLIKGPVGFVSILGRAGQGKSSVLNQLLGHKKGFEAASTYEPCTKGLWMWSTPLKRTLPECNIILLDSEGMDAYEQTGKSSIPIFSLLVLLSSMLIWNQMGGERSVDALDCLSQVMEMTKHLRGASGGKSVELGQFSPVFVWLLRDFCQDLTQNNRKMTPRDYLDLALGPVQGGGSSAKNAVRESIRAHFPDRECFTLVRPVSNEKDLHRLDQLAETNFRPEFRSGLDALREFVLDRTSPIPFGGSSMTGPMLAELTQSFLDTINSGTVAAISLSRQSVEEAQYPRPCNSFDGKSKLEELRFRKRELDEARARNVKLRILLEEKNQKLAKAKEESRVAFQVRKKAEQALLDAKGTIRTYLRICPIANDDDTAGPKEKESVVTVDDDVVNIEESTRSYRFDKVFSDKSSQSEIFNELYDLVQSAIDGNKVCIFAFGQSGTGKTYTMIGELKMDNDIVNVNAGLILRALKLIFDQTKDRGYVIKLCVSEIYNNTNQNLIDPVTLNDLDMAIKILRKANGKRASNDTKWNNKSSRSHCFFHIEIQSPANMVSEVCFVDLAGSERYDNSASNSACGETKAILKGLFNLKQHLRALATKTISMTDHSCKLNQELTPYLSAGSKTSIFATLSQERRRMKESKRTLDFVDSIKSLNLDDD